MLSDTIMILHTIQKLFYAFYYIADSGQNESGHVANCLTLEKIKRELRRKAKVKVAICMVNSWQVEISIVILSSPINEISQNLST